MNALRAAASEVFDAHCPQCRFLAFLLILLPAFSPMNFSCWPALPKHPAAFCRNRDLPLHALVALPLTGMRMSIQSELDSFFAHLHQRAQFMHVVSRPAFAKARAELSLTAIPTLNDWPVERAGHDGFVPRWRGLCLVATGASPVCFELAPAM